LLEGRVKVEHQVDTTGIARRLSSINLLPYHVMADLMIARSAIRTE